MKRILVLLLLCGALVGVILARRRSPSDGGAAKTGGGGDAGIDTAIHTLRVDYNHKGTATEEHFSVDRIVREPLAWPGSPTRALDDSNLGKYFFEVRDSAS